MTAIAPLAAASRQRDRKVFSLCALGLAALFAYFLIYDYHRLNNGRFGDFPTFYDAARAMRDGRDPYLLWGEQYYIYPPLIAFLMTPLAKLSQLQAARVFLGVNVGCMVLSVIVAAREMARRLGGTTLPGAVGAVALLAALLGENATRNQLQTLETDVLMLLMFTLSLAWLDKRPLRAGAALAFAINIKYLSIVALPWLLLRRRWSAVGGILLWTVVFAFLPAPLLGWRLNAHYLRVALNGPIGWVRGGGESAPDDLIPAGAATPGAATTGAANTANTTNPSRVSGAAGTAHAARVLPVTDNVSLSITSALARWMKRAGGSLMPALAASAALAGACVLLAWRMYALNGLPCWAWPGRRAQAAEPFRQLIAIEWAGLIVVAMAFSPDTNPRHLVMLLIVHAAAAAILLLRGGDDENARAGRPAVSRRPLLLGTILLGVALFLPWKGVMSHQFFLWWYPGAVPTWCLLVMYGTLLWVGLRLAGSRINAGPRSQSALPAAEPR